MMGTAQVANRNIALAIRVALPMRVQKVTKSVDVLRDQTMLLYRIVIKLADGSTLCFYIDIDNTEYRLGEPMFNDEFWTWITLLANNETFGRGEPKEYSWRGNAGK